MRCGGASSLTELPWLASSVTRQRFAGTIRTGLPDTGQNAPIRRLNVVSLICHARSSTNVDHKWLAALRLPSVKMLLYSAVVGGSGVQAHVC